MTVFKKSLLVLTLAAFGLSAALVTAVLVFMNSLYYETNTRSLRNTAGLLRSLAGEQLRNYFSVTDGGSIPLPDGIFPGADFSSYRLTLIDKAGNVIWDSLVDGELVNHLDREEVTAALEGREGRSRRGSLSAGGRQMYCALPVFGSDGGVTGIFRLSMTIPGFWQRIFPSALSFLFLACLLFLAAFAGIFAFSRSFSASLKRLADIVAAAVENRYSSRRISAIPAGMAGETVEFLNLEQSLRDMAMELKTRLEQARSEGQRLRAILNGMSEAVFAVDLKLTLHLANPRARTLFNLADRDLTSQRLGGLSLLEATHSTELEQAARRVLQEGKPLEMELQVLSNAGSAGPGQRFHVYAAPLASPASADAEKDSEGVVLVMADITPMIRLEQVRKDFVANVSHELRTPIQLIKGFSETLLDSPPEDLEQIRHFIGIIHKSAETMEKLTGDLLTLASLENGDNSRYNTEEQPVASLFTEALSSVEPKARQKQIEIIVDCPAELNAKLHGSFIIQALINLLDNGIKYSPAASTVRASAIEENGSLVLEVRDQGIGIPLQHQGRIFERFYRVDRSHSKKANGKDAPAGTGLGLSIVRHIALLHNGTVEVESRPGEGSVFRIRLPQKRNIIE